jgi:hypothetical protein
MYPYDDNNDNIEETKNVKFYQQIASGYIFQGDSEDYLVTARQYTRGFRVWEISKAPG